MSTTATGAPIPFRQRAEEAMGELGRMEELLHIAGKHTECDDSLSSFLSHEINQITRLCLAARRTLSQAAQAQGVLHERFEWSVDVLERILPRMPRATLSHLDEIKQEIATRVDNIRSDALLEPLLRNQTIQNPVRESSKSFWHWDAKILTDYINDYLLVNYPEEVSFSGAHLKLLHQADVMSFTVLSPYIKQDGRRGQTIQAPIPFRLEPVGAAPQGGFLVKVALEEEVELPEQAEPTHRSNHHEYGEDVIGWVERHYPSANEEPAESAPTGGPETSQAREAEAGALVLPTISPEQRTLLMAALRLKLYEDRANDAQMDCAVRIQNCYAENTVQMLQDLNEELAQANIDLKAALEAHSKLVTQNLEGKLNEAVAAANQKVREATKGQNDLLTKLEEVNKRNVVLAKSVEDIEVIAAALQKDNAEQRAEIARAKARAEEAERNSNNNRGRGCTIL